MPYLSHILGAHVVDSSGQMVGTISDLAVTVEEPFGGEFPPLTLVLVRAGSASLRLRSELFTNLGEAKRGRDVKLDATRAHLTVGQEKEGEVYLRRDVLDKQILDASNGRLVRVNDVYLFADENGKMRAAGVDVSLRGLLRRIRLEERATALAKQLHVPLVRQHIPWNELEVLRTEEGGKMRLKVPTERLSKLHPTDLARVVQQMSPAERTEVFEQLDVETAAYALEEVDDEIAADIVEALDTERAADIIEEMEPDEAADVLGEMDSERAAEAILQAMDDPEEAADIKQLLSYEEDTAGALMTTDIAYVRAGCTAEQTIAQLRANPPAADSLHYIHVEDGDEMLVGVVSLAEVVLADPRTPIIELLRDETVTVEPDASTEECAQLIARYDLLSLPVVDTDGKLLGAVTVDDVIDAIAPEEWKDRLPRLFAPRVAAVMDGEEGPDA